jgi:tetratricopeptide (TPR) repeat protein
VKNPDPIFHGRGPGGNPPRRPGRSCFKAFPTWFWAFLIVGSSTLLQMGALSYGEVIDDHDLLHSDLQRGCGTHPAACFQHPLFELYYRPLMTASFSVGLALHGARPFWFHRENLILHAAVVAQAVWFFRLLFRRERPALLAGLLFGLHPLHVCVTTFIGGRTDTLALFFLFWFVIGLLKSESTPLPPDNPEIYPSVAPGGASARRIGWRIVAWLGFTGAIFTKEQCLLLIVLAPLLTTLHAAGTGRRSSLWLLLFGLPILAYLLAARQVIPFGSVEPPDWSPALRVEMVGRTLWYYVKALLFPIVHTIHASTLGPWDTPQPLVMLLGFLCGGVWLAGLRYAWPNRSLRLLMLWTTLTLLPCLNLVPIPSQFAASYRAVLPLVGIAGLAGAALDALGRRRQAGHSLPGRSPVWRLAWLVVPICLAYLWGVEAEMAAWQNDLALMVAETQADPNFLPALGGLANALHEAGRDAEALAVYDRVMARLLPDAVTNAARIALSRTPRMRRSLKSQSGLRYTPEIYIPMEARGRGGVCQTLGRYESAIESYQLTLAFNPYDEVVRDALATCYLANGHVGQAEEALRELAARTPTAYHLWRLGTLYAREGRWPEAKTMLARTLAAAASSRTANMAAWEPTRQLYEEAVRRTRALP